MIFESIFKALQEAGVRYLTVGGVATVFHGYARFTGDLDLIVDLEHQNCLTAIEVLVGLGLRPRAPVNPLDFADEAKRKDWTENKGLTVFSLIGGVGVPTEVDLFVDEPFPFEDLWSRRIEKTIDGITVNVIDLASLIALKKMAGRPQDLEDVRELEDLN